MPQYKLLHVTPILNIDSIEALGLRPDYAEGRRHVIWMCDRERLPWALAHISIRRALPVRDLMVCTLALHEEELIKTRWKGVYVSKSVLLPETYQSSETWLKRVESGGL